MKSFLISKVLFSAIGLVALFFVMRWMMSPVDLIVLLNGLFVGSLAAVAVAYWELILAAIRGDTKYDRIQQMTIGFALCWTALAVAAFSSVYVYSADLPTNALTSVSFGRYIAIIAAILQVTAPDFGLGLFHGRDRKVLATSFIVGLTVAVLVIILQDNSALAAP